MLIINPGEYEALRRHGEETYPHECCGVLLGTFRESTRVVTRTVRCGNTRQDRPQDRYDIDPRELIVIQRQASEQGLEIVGFYHSHPDHPAQWSATDLAEAHWVGCSYVITSVVKGPAQQTNVAQGSAQQTNSFALLGESEDDKHFETETISLAAAMEDQTICH